MDFVLAVHTRGIFLDVLGEERMLHFNDGQEMQVAVFFQDGEDTRQFFVGIDDFHDDGQVVGAAEHDAAHRVVEAADFRAVAFFSPDQGSASDVLFPRFLQDAAVKRLVPAYDILRGKNLQRPEFDEFHVNTSRERQPAYRPKERGLPRLH